MGVSFHKRKRGQKPAEKKPKVQHTSAGEVAKLLLEHNDLLRQIIVNTSQTVMMLGTVVSTIEGQPQASKVQLLTKLVEGQRALADTIMLLTAKGVTKAREKKPTPQEITEQANATGREIGAEQRAAAATPAAPAAPVEAQKAELKVVPPPVPVPTPVSTGASTPAAAGAGGVEVPTQDALKSAFLAFVQKHGREKGIDLLKSYGAANVAAVPPSQYSSFHARCTG